MYKYNYSFMEMKDVIQTQIQKMSSYTEKQTQKMLFVDEKYELINSQ